MTRIKIEDIRNTDISTLGTCIFLDHQVQPSGAVRWANDNPIVIEDKIRLKLAIFPNFHFLTKPLNAFF